MPTLDLLTFTCAGSTYAVPAAEAIAIVPLGEPTPVPGTPPAIRGVVNHRGRILPVLDVARIVAPAAPGAPPAFGIVVATGDACFVVAAEAAPLFVTLEADRVTAAEQLGDRPDGTVGAVTSDAVGILDVAALARDPRVAVDDGIE